VIDPGSESDAELATRLATDAGRLLVELRRDLWAKGASSWHVMDSGDLAAHRFLLGALGTHRPGDVVMSEEGADDRRRASADRVWIVDPLDGTNEYGEPGRHDWAVHVALWERGSLRAGAVALPAIGITFATDPPPELTSPERERPRLITSRNRPPYSAAVVAEALGCDAVRLGSAGAKTMAIIMGEADIYVHDGGMYQWDSAAPAAVAAAAGLHVSRIDGSPLRYNDPDPWLPDLLICRPELAERVLDALWGVGRRPYRRR
jgi:3'(2'), 5'-bisphosphate nucleotidase